MKRQITLIFLIMAFLEVSSDTHYLQYIYTAVRSGIPSPRFSAVGRVDGEEFVHYNSTSMTMIPMTDWTKKIKTDDPEYWNKETELMGDQQDRFQNMLKLNQGAHELKWIYSCQSDDKAATSYMRYSCDGKDFFHLDLKTGTWIADTPQAKTFIKKWDHKGEKAESFKDYLETECNVWLEKLVSYRTDALNEKGETPDGELDEEPDKELDEEPDGEPFKDGVWIGIVGAAVGLLFFVIVGKSALSGK